MNTLPMDPTAVMGRRVVAWIIDIVVWIAVAAALFTTFAKSISLVDAQFAGTKEELCDIYEIGTGGWCFGTGDGIIWIDAAQLFWMYASALIYWIVNLVLLSGATGASIGKHIVRLRVVHQSDGTLHGFSAATVRWLLWIVDGFFYIFPIVGLVTASASKGHRRVGDMAASTFVVDKSQVGIVPIVPGQSMAAKVGATRAVANRPGQSRRPRRYARLGSPTPTRTQPTPNEAPHVVPEEPKPSSTQSVASRKDAEIGRPGVDAPLWDDARDTYIQWDPVLKAWMEWSDSKGRWLRIRK